MSRVILITGGARSGKSSYAQRIAKENGGKRAFIATAVTTDEEMRERILRHKEERGKDFFTYEEPEKIAALLKEIINKYEIILVDCLTFFISNLLIKGLTDEEIYKECDLILERLSGSNSTVIFVSNEVGMGIVPDNALARRFRDIAGRVNQKFANSSDEVYLIVSGIPLKIK